MRFVIINLLLVCLLLLGISYLAFGHTGTTTDSEPHLHQMDDTFRDSKNLKIRMLPYFREKEFFNAKNDLMQCGLLCFYC